MAKNKAERKKELIRIGALAIAGIMILSLVLAIVLQA